MQRAEPILGFPSKTAAAAAALRARGLGWGAIGDCLGISASIASSLVSNARKRQDGRPVKVAATTIDRLGPAARARGVAVDVLIRRLLDTIADDGLVDAILVDGEG